MDLSLSEEQRLLKKTVREFAEAEIGPHAREWDEKQEFPREVFTKLGELGLMGVVWPAEYGGSGMSTLDYAIVMEELSRGVADEEMRNEVFICGVFSLLDRMFQQPFAQLLESIPVPERVRQALVEETGPFQPYLDVVRAVESESLFEFREAADKLMMSVNEINRAQLRALMQAAELE